MYMPTAVLTYEETLRLMVQSLEHLQLLLACNGFVPTVTAVRSRQDLLPIFELYILRHEPLQMTPLPRCGILQGMSGCLSLWAFTFGVTSETTSLGGQNWMFRHKRLVRSVHVAMVAGNPRCGPW
jgi:hypothetical protein